MCGRFSIATSEEQLLEAFKAGLVVSADALPLPDNNIFPSSTNLKHITNAPVIRKTGSKRTLEYFTWPFIPQWANCDMSRVVGKYSTINAKIENIAESRSYKHAWHHQQCCLIPLTGFYEWQLLDNGRKQPYLISLKHTKLFAMAGIWESSSASQGQSVNSFSIITMPANPLMARIHNSKQRMPLILDDMQYDDWLSGDPDRVKACISPYPEEEMDAYPVIMPATPGQAPVRLTQDKENPG